MVVCSEHTGFCNCDQPLFLLSSTLVGQVSDNDGHLKRQILLLCQALLPLICNNHLNSKFSLDLFILPLPFLPLLIFLLPLHLLPPPDSFFSNAFDTLDPLSLLVQLSAFKDALDDRVSFDVGIRMRRDLAEDTHCFSVGVGVLDLWGGSCGTVVDCVEGVGEGG